MKSFYLLFLFILIVLILPSPILATFSKNLNNPVVKIGVSQDWDNKYVYAPSVLFQNNRMWYSGSNGNKRQIGYSNSSVLDNWSKFSENPIIKWDVLDILDVGIEHPIVLNSSNNYQLWFNNVSNLFPNFKLYYSTSVTGTSWNQPQSLIFISSTSTWDTNGRTAPSVIYSNENNLYRMWFTANGNYDGYITWRIGYATSSDGVNWTKHPEPVLKPDQAWESRGSGGGIGNPSVYYENGLYHMFYHGDRDIGHAVSTDGINWTKDPDNPVLTPGSGDDFDNLRVMDPFVLKNNIDGKYYMYYTGVNRSDKWQIGLATADTIPNVIPPPDDGLNLPIIIIPGLGASWNPKAMLSCELAEKNSWEMAPFASVYKRFIKTLTKSAKLKLNEDVFVYTYDWRQPLDIQGEELKKFIDKILDKREEGAKVTLVGHSLGGLVIRSYLTNNQTSHRVKKVLTIGTPHQGTALAYPIWEKGEIWINDRILKLAIFNLLNFCRFRHPASFSENNLPKIIFHTNKELIQQFAPSIKSLLPIFEFLRRNNETIPIDQMTEKNDWLPFHPLSFQNVKITTLSGNEISTLRFLDVIDPSTKEVSIGDWIDGKPQNRESINEGDGTILSLSSRLTGANNLQISGDHIQIVTSDNGIATILRFLGLPGVQPAEVEVQPELISREILNISLDKEYNFEITAPKRKTYKSENNLITIYDPLGGAYRLKVFPKTKDSVNLFANLISDEKDREWNFSLKINKLTPVEVLLMFTSGRNPQMKLLQ